MQLMFFFICILHLTLASVLGERLTVSYVNLKPFSYNESGVLKGLYVDIVNLWAEQDGYKLDFKEVPDGFFGAFTRQTNEWSGLVGQLNLKRADLALGPLTVTSDRSRVIDFSDPIGTGGIVMITKRPARGDEVRITRLSNLLTKTKAPVDSDFGAVSSGSTLAFFTHSSHDVYAHLGTVLAKKSLPNSIGEGVRRVKSQNYVFIGEKVILEYYARTDCELMLAGNEVNSQEYAFGFQNGANKKTSDFNRFLQRIKSDGTLERLHSSYFKDRCEKVEVCMCQKQAGWNETFRRYQTVSTDLKNGSQTSKLALRSLMLVTALLSDMWKMWLF